jgi:hypothetical protein
VVVARVRDEVLYSFFPTPSTPLHSCQTHVLANVRQVPHPLRYPLADTLLLAVTWPLIEIREDPVEDPSLCIGFTPLPLGSSTSLIVVSLFAAISPARAQIQLRHRFAFWFSSIPGVRGRPLLGPSLGLIVVSVSILPLMPPLRFF